MPAISENWKTREIHGAPYLLACSSDGVALGLQSVDGPVSAVDSSDHIVYTAVEATGLCMGEYETGQGLKRYEYGD